MLAEKATRANRGRLGADSGAVGRVGGCSHGPALPDRWVTIVLGIGGLVCVFLLAIIEPFGYETHRRFGVTLRRRHHRRLGHGFLPAPMLGGNGGFTTRLGKSATRKDRPSHHAV